MNTELYSFVPKTGVEPARLSTHAPETCASTNSATWASIERKTRLELATPTLARLCSTNWAISALKVKRRRLELPRLAALPPQSSASTIPPPLHFLITKYQCPRQESNLHASRHTHLKRARLPIPPLGQALSGKRGSNSRPQPWQGCALPTELFPQFLWCALWFSLSIVILSDGLSSELRCKGMAFFWMLQVFWGKNQRKAWK